MAAAQCYILNEINLAASQKEFRQQPLTFENSTLKTHFIFIIQNSVIIIMPKKALVYVARPNTSNNTCQREFKVA